jgi:hypothetical protein
LVEPDLAGFAEAQQRHRTKFGEDVVFLGEVTAVFPGGTPLDPETGDPYDPALQPTSSGQASAVVRCTVAWRSASEEGGGSAGGWFEAMHITLSADIAERAKIDGKMYARVRGIRYLITQAEPDGIAGVQRMVIACRKESEP